MKTFLKKYWVPIIFLVASTLLFFILIPYAENSYLKTDIRAIRKNSQFVLAVTILVLVAIVFISTFKHLKTVKAFLNTLLSMFSLGLLLYFVLNSIFLFGAFALNKLYANKVVEKKYKVISTDNNYILLQNVQSGKLDFVEQITQENERYLIKPNDTITLRFKKGLFGFEFGPKHRKDVVVPAKL